MFRSADWFSHITLVRSAHSADLHEALLRATDTMLPSVPVLESLGEKNDVNLKSRLKDLYDQQTALNCELVRFKSRANGFSCA